MTSNVSDYSSVLPR